jgi:hypothetical protein
MSLIDKTNAILIGLTVLAGSMCGLLLMLIKVASLMKQLRHEVNSRLSELIQSASAEGHAMGQMLGRQEGRDEIRALDVPKPGEPLSHADLLEP